MDPNLPLVDLHRHLDGNVRLTTILELAKQHGVPLPADNAADLLPYVQIDGKEPGLMAFLERFKYLTAILVDLEACRRIAYENVLDMQRHGIDYAELRFSPWFMAESHQLDPASVVAAVADGVTQGREETGLPCQLIGILSRTYGPEICHRELDALLANRQHLIAVDLAGDEAGYPAPLFKDHFRKVADAGLAVTVHAGEADGAASVWSAIRDLGASRIGHGFRSLEDPKLVDFLVEHEIPLEVCITSNLHISAVADYPSHPVTQMAEAGLKVTLNSDDPSISGIDLPHEIEQAAPAAGMSEAQIRQARLNAVDAAFLSEADKAALRAKKAN
ncbi:MAG: adenosine deaminase [Pseudomonadota bacterium]